MKAKKYINKKFGFVKALMINGKVWFVAYDVVNSLYRYDKRAVIEKISQNCKCVLNRQTDKELWNLVTSLDGDLNRASYLNEGNIILIDEFELASFGKRSKLKSSAEYLQWIFLEVIPDMMLYRHYTNKFSCTQFVDEEFNEEVSEIMAYLLS